MTVDTGHRRRAGDRPPVIGDLIDGETVGAIAQDAWTALVGEDEVLVPVPGAMPGAVLSSWVDMTGPWTGTVVLTTGARTAVELTEALLGAAAPPVLDDEDVADALGELANVVGGNVKAALPPPSILSLPRVGTAPTACNPADVCRVEVLWRGQPLAITVQGLIPPLPARSPISPRPASRSPHAHPTTPFPRNGASQ